MRPAVSTAGLSYCLSKLITYIYVIKLKYMTQQQIEQHFIIKKIKDTDKETIYTIELPNNDGEAKICITKPQIKMYGNLAVIIEKYKHLI